MSTSPITILGIDPGYDRIGWAVAKLTGSTMVDVSCGLIQTQRTQSLVERYHDLDQQLSTLLQTHHPQEAAVETLYFSQNKTTALKVAEARGVILSCLLRHQVKICEYNPMTIKQAVTGYGKADKPAIDKMVRLQLGKFLNPGQKQIDDTMDALAVLLTHSTSRRLPQ